MAQMYVSGPCSIWVSPGPSGTPLFLGHAERTPSIQIRPSFSPVFCDLTGQRVPMDYLYDGEEAMVSLDTTRWNESVYASIANRANPASIVRGTDNAGALGTLMGLEGKAFPLWLRFPYAVKPAFSALPDAMPAGYRFPLAFLEGPDGLDQNGTTNRKIRLSFHCIRQVTFNGTNAYGKEEMLLYDHNTSAVSGLSID